MADFESRNVDVYILEILGENLKSSLSLAQAYYLNTGDELFKDRVATAANEALKFINEYVEEQIYDW
jgi:hypothetical protein